MSSVGEELLSQCQDYTYEQLNLGELHTWTSGKCLVVESQNSDVLNNLRVVHLTLNLTKYRKEDCQ